MESAHLQTSTGALNVLVAEDNPDDVFLLQEAFRKVGYGGKIHSVSDGAETVQYLKGDGAYGDRVAHPFPDLVLLDLNMPRMNGFEVLSWLRQEPDCSGLPVHILTASARPCDVARGYELGANSYVIKPAKLQDLVDFVAALQEWHRFVVRVSPPGNSHP